MSEFRLTEDLVKLLRSSCVNRDLSGCEYGAAEIDPKRPYGNSDVEGDIAEILGWKVDPIEGPTREQQMEAAAIHAETPRALQFILDAGTFEPGTYRRESRTWVRVGD